MTSDKDDLGRPGATVEVSTNGSDWFDAVVLTFDGATPAVWSGAQTIHAGAIDDDAQEGTRKAIINHSILSDDPAFNGLAIPNLELTVLDNGRGALVITPTNNSNVVLEGTTPGAITDTFSVALTVAPTSSVDVTLHFDGAQIGVDGSFGGSHILQFGPGDWNIPQTVTLSAFDDAVRENRTASLITYSVAMQTPPSRVSMARKPRSSCWTTTRQVSSSPRPTAPRGWFAASAATAIRCA